MPKKPKTCGYCKTHGGAFEWRCVLDIHEGDSHYFKPFKVAKKTSI